MNDAAVESVRSLWVPLSGSNLLVPNVAIAEVIGHQPYETLAAGPDWLLGSLRWRDILVPVVSMERLLGFEVPDAGRGARIAVVNSVKADSGLSFYAMPTAGIPRLFAADEDALGAAVEAGEARAESVACAVQIGSEKALVPNMEVIQVLIAETWKQFF